MINKSKLKNIIYNTSIVVVFLCFTYLQGVVGVLNYLVFVFIYSLIFFVFYFSWKYFRKKETMSYKKFFILFLQKISLSIIIIVSILGGFTYWQNEISPAKMPRYTLSNGEKTVIFQAMSHIGTKQFYMQVKNDLIDTKKKGFVYFYEGVKPGKKENMEAFNKAIGIQFNKDLYSNFSKLYGVTNQDNSIYLGLVNNLDFNVDVSIDYIMEKYDISKIEKKETNASPIDINSNIIETLANLNPRELKILVYINKAILNFIIKSEKLQATITNNFANKALFDIILHGRNEIVAEQIIKSKYNKIYVTYGLLHFKGVLELLKQNDSSWKIVETKYLIPID